MTATDEQITEVVDGFTDVLSPPRVEEEAARLDMPVDDLLKRISAETKARIEGGTEAHA